MAGALAVAGVQRWFVLGALAGPRLATGAVLAVSLLVLASPVPPVLQRAAVAASGVVILPFAFLVAAGDRFPSFTVVAVMGGGGLAVLYLLGPSPGHSFHLTVLAAAAWLAALSAGGSGVGDVLFGGFRTLDDLLADAGLASLAVGGAQLAVGWWLDCHRLVGMATPLFGVGTLATGVGVFVTIGDIGDLVASVIVVAVAGAVIGAGWPGHRRGVLWAGLGGAGIGGVLLARAVAPGDGTLATALVVAGLGATTVAVASAVAARADRTEGPKRNYVRGPD